MILQALAFKKIKANQLHEKRWWGGGGTRLLLQTLHTLNVQTNCRQTLSGL